MAMGCATVAMGQGEMPLPAVPDSLRTPPQRAEWLAVHFFDLLDPDEPALKADPEWLPRTFATYATLMPLLDAAQADSAAVAVMASVAASAPELFGPIADLANEYLGERQSPVYNAQGYAAFLRAIASSPASDQGRRLRAEAQLKAYEANRPGTIGADFAMKLRECAPTTLRQQLREADVPVLVLFHDPECEDCAALIASMQACDALAEAIGAGRAKVVCVNVGGDEQAWHDDPGHIPAGWIDAFSPEGEVMTEEIYFLPTLPALYVMTPEGEVVLREATLEEAVQALK